MRMCLALSFAGLFAVLTAPACASNEPASTSVPGAAPTTTESPASLPSAEPTAAAPTPAPSPSAAPSPSPSPSPSPAAKTCNYGGKTRALGDSFPSTDGCNTCVCEAGGPSCTELACPKAAAACDPAKEPNREYKMRNVDLCKTALFRCSDGKKPFFNSCGCGCE